MSWEATGLQKRSAGKLAPQLRTLFHWPVAPLAIAFGVIALTVVAVRSPSGSSEDNPTEVIVNTSSKQILVVNKARETLWKLNYLGYKEVSQEEIAGSFAFADVTGDGRNEVYDVYPWLSEGDAPKDVLRSYGSDGGVRFTVALGREIEYRGERFANSFTLRRIVGRDFDRDGRPEFLVGMAHRHSPYSLLRLDQQGRPIGEYWHFGHYWNLVLLPERGGKSIVALCGTDDAEWKGRAVLTLLDPNLIHGVARSRQSPGFPFPASEAEQLTLVFPRTVLDDDVSAKPRVTGFTFSDGYSVGIRVSNEVEGPGPELEYIADNEWNILDVRPNDEMRRMFEERRRDGFLSSGLDTQYMESLKKGVLKISWKDQKGIEH